MALSGLFGREAGLLPPRLAVRGLYQHLVPRLELADELGEWGVVLLLLNEMARHVVHDMAQHGVERDSRAPHTGSRTMSPHTSSS